MAYYAALLSVIELLEDILHPHRVPNCFDGSTTPTFNSLHQKFTQLLDSLKDYSSVGCDPDPMEARIRDASLQALDLIEAQIPKHQHVSLGGLDWQEELHKVGQEVDSIVQQLTATKQPQMHQRIAAAASEQHQQQPAPIDISNMPVGFEEQVMAIKEKLCGLSPQLEVIPIVGMGGIGKTTLATHTFRDPLIVRAFDFRGWVTISQDYDVVRILQDLIKSLGITVKHPDELNGGQGEALVEHERRVLKDSIHKYLKWRKFLIVIDDIWDTQVWDDIKHIFPNDCNGSRIVLTTRLGDMAEYAGIVDSIHQMQFLNEDASWTLLREKIFANDPCPSELVNIGKCIASKCKGLPIAIVVIAGILFNDKTLQYWENFAKDVGSFLGRDDEHLFNILSMSYQHLPHHLKPCFLHMGSFREDYEINISKLIMLWIVEGFLGTVSKSKKLQKIGYDYLEDLVKRNLVIITKEHASGEFKSCIMHDVLRDFCRQKGFEEHFFDVTDSEGHLKTNGVRKYVWSNARFMNWQLPINYDQLKGDGDDLLRALGAPGMRASAIPFAVSNMFRLKCIVFDPPFAPGIDPFIFKFQNLEILIIDSKNLSLPSEIWKMAWLKYLIIPPTTLPPILLDVPHQKLEDLHTLQSVENFICTNEVIQTIPNVRKLKIRYTRESNDIWELHGRLNNLHNLLQLEKLDMFCFGFIPPKVDLMGSKHVFPQNLKKLCLYGCILPWEAMTYVGSLKHLQVLKLREDAFAGDVWAPEEEEFLELKFLLLEHLDLKEWRAERTHFPKLQHLQIKYCWRLEEVPSDIGEIGPLKSIAVIDCRNAEASAKKIKEEQQELGNYGLQVMVHGFTLYPKSR